METQTVTIFEFRRADSDTFITRFRVNLVDLGENGFPTLSWVRKEIGKGKYKIIDTSIGTGKFVILDTEETSIDLESKMGNFEIRRHHNGVLLETISKDKVEVENGFPSKQWINKEFGTGKFVVWDTDKETSAIIEISESKALDVTSSKDFAKVSDIKVFGNPDLWRLICKASSESQGWMKSTKAMYIHGFGCLVQVTTQQRNPDGSYSIAEAVTAVPGTRIIATAPGQFQMETI